VRGHFEDAQRLQKQHPTTFEAPSLSELSGLRVGQFIKVCTEGERFWVKLEAIEEDKLFGRVDNELVFTERHGLRYNDKVTVQKRHVYDVLKEGESDG